MTSIVADRPRLLHDLDSHTQSSGKSLRGIAAQDEQFLKYDAEQTARTSSTATLNQILDSATLVLDWLQLQGRQSSIKRKNSNEDCDKLKYEKFFANLEHLIRCLRHAVIEALLQERLLQIQFWGQYLQQQRQIEGWFAEWPNGQPPLNTTWPWNVKPSLVVLWGVCWMFYDHDINISWVTPPRGDQLRLPGNLRAGLSPFRVENNNHIQQRPRKSTGEGHTLNRHQKYSSSDTFSVAGASFDPVLNPEQNPQWLHAVSSGDRVTASDSSGAQSQDQVPRAYNITEFYPYIYSTSTNPSTTQYIDNTEWSVLEDWNPQHTNWQPSGPTTTPPQTSEPQGKVGQPYVPGSQSLETSVPETAACSHPGMPAMPTQTNEFSTQEPPSPCLSRSPLSPSAPNYPASTSSIGSPNTNHKGNMEAVRKEDGLLHCAHVDCVKEPRAFSRRCEYT